ncbi:T9SS type A sorting domain-containing protein [Lacinutrix neustonica]|uniref:T9SS type A sorting domain-containing protein n=1 Tax=Lacinutrix neustonica TaxID=2980107 RepID=A0A9E8MSU4_9FLAO|nr:T9SS type A sorting domain-containing protein [Lacinutrix neustonica]WAC00808.1 T9SS type A sorting domain-containing protein [Lacinutrix neustonica]
MSAGTWILTVVDDANQDGGTLNSFDLELCVQGTLSVDKFETTISNFILYPNPNNGSFNIQLANTSTNGIEVSVFDIRGRSVYNKRYPNTPNFNETITLESAQSGLYILQVSDGVNTQTKKIVVN